jgi:prolyl oligopeptidase
MRLVTVCVGAVLVWVLCAAVDAAPADDPFVWLESVDGQRARDWVRGQNDYTLKVLAGDPNYKEALVEAEAILTAPDRIPYGDLAAGQVYNFWQDRAHVHGVWRRTSLTEYQETAPQWETLLDLDALSRTQNENWVWKGALCLPPAHLRCLVKLSRGGSDAVVVHEFDVASRSFVRGGFDVAEAKTDIAWIDADNVMVATNWGPDTLTKAGYPRIVKAWRRGQSLRDAQTIYEAETGDVALALKTVFGEGGRVDRLIVRGLDFFRTELFNVDAAWRVTRIAVPEYAEFKGIHRGQLLFQLMRDWRTAGRTFLQGSVISFSLDGYLKSGGALPAIKSLFTPDARTVVSAVATSKDAVYLSLLQNVKGRVHEVTFDGAQWLWRRIALPDDGTADIVSASDADGQVMLRYADFLTPDTLYLVQPQAEPRAIKQLPPRFDAYGFEVTQFEALAADGAKIPYFLVRKEDTLNNGRTPTLLYAYGGFNIATTPWYWSTAGKLWLENGGAIAVANVRGGGEFGPRWHEAAQGVNRQRNFDDFAAVARDMIARGISSSKHLGAMGASQGGLLVTATAIQNPGLFNAVLAQVPLTDMLRYTQMSAGASWIAEYGDPADPRQRAAILRWSPYQNIRAGTKYPRIFFLGSTRDDRVHPGHARKMAAKMQANGAPYLYFETTDGGHDLATTLRRRAEQLALTYTYFRRQLMN